MLPSFSGLQVGCVGAPSTPTPSIRSRWMSRCGDPPDLTPWNSLRSRDKRRLLHDVAVSADDDSDSDGDYVTAYEEIDIDDLSVRDRSVEHVVPRSFLSGSAPSKGEDDPLGWIVATRRSNSRRSNHPLYLWLEPDNTIALPNTLVRVEGELHYVPPLPQRARLARKWLFVRATYRDVSRPSKAQVKHAASIVSLAKHYPLQPVELRVNEHYRKTLGWANPLLEDGADEWYSNAEWRALVFS